MFNTGYINTGTGSDNTSIKKVLLIEDDEYCAYTIIKLLKDNLDIVHKYSGIDGIKEANSRHYDLLLLDIGLKDLSGVDVLKSIKCLPEYQDTPSIAVTAYAMLGDKERLLCSGFNFYIAKPFSIKEFRELINTALSSQI